METATKKKPKFLRRTSNRYSKLGKRRKKKQIWRRPTGRDNKMREKRKGYPAIVSVGYKTPKKEKETMLIKNIRDLEKINGNKIAVMGKIGMKKKIEIVKKAKEMKIEFSNVNIKNFLKEVEKKGKVVEKKTDNEKKEKVETKKNDVKEKPVENKK